MVSIYEQLKEEAEQMRKSGQQKPEVLTAEEFGQLLSTVDVNEVEDPSILSLKKTKQNQGCQHNCKLCKICNNFNATSMKDSCHTHSNLDQEQNELEK